MLKFGDEVSINLKDVPELKDAEKGEEIELAITCRVIGKHTHSAGKTEEMIDLEVIGFETENGREDGEEDDLQE